MSLSEVATARGSQTEPRARALCPLPVWSLSALLTLLAAGVFAWPGLAPVLEFDRLQLTEVWRIFTCHFTHYDLEHLFWDGVMFAALAAVLESRSRGRLIGCIVASAVAIPLAIQVFLPDVPTYRGLSGIDSALFTLVVGVPLKEAFNDLRRDRVILLSLLALGFVAKVTYELITGQVLFANSSAFTPVALSHVVGGAVGLVLAFGYRPRDSEDRTCCSFRAFLAEVLPSWKHYRTLSRGSGPRRGSQIKISY